MSKSSSRTKKTVILEGFNPNSPLVTDDMALDYLAQLDIPHKQTPLLRSKLTPHF